jgi:UDP-glucose 4-epimerase
MRLLITGGAGYIGSHTTHLLAAQGHDIVVLDNLVYGHRKAIVDDNVQLVIGNLEDRDLVPELFQKHAFDAVLHFAAFAYVGESIGDPLKYYRNNTAAPLVLLEAMRDAGCKQIVFSSSCATYGEPDQFPISECESQEPVNPYGWSKLMLERILADCGPAWGLRSVCLRYFNACGAALDGSLGEDHDPETHLIPRLLLAVKGDIDHVEIFGDDYNTPDGTCIRDYIHVDDLAAGHAAALNYLQTNGASLGCNLGTGKGHSVKEIIQCVENVTGATVPLVYRPRREGDPASLVANASMAREKLGWQAKHTNIALAITTAWNWMTRAHATTPSGQRQDS